MHGGGSDPLPNSNLIKETSLPSHQSECIKSEADSDGTVQRMVVKKFSFIWKDGRWAGIICKYGK